MPDPSALLEWLRQQGVDFRLPEVLWALALVPALLAWLVVARVQRRRVVDAFRVGGPGRLRRRTPGAALRLIGLGLLVLSLAGMIVGFARPVVPMDTPNDAATVVFVVDGSIAMRATDVRPTRFEAARGVAGTAVGALPDRLQVAVVSYARAAYVALAPTHDQGAAPGAVGRIRTADGAALGDALAVALATIPVRDPAAGTGGSPAGASGAGVASGSGAAPAAPANPGQSALAAKAPAVIVVISSGVLDTGRPLADAAAAAREAQVPVHVVGVGPRAGAEQKAPYDEATLRQLARATGGRYLAAPSANDWKDVYRPIGSATTFERKPQEIGHYVGAAALGVAALAMALSLIAARRLV
jgi:Ca-activated chloride channel family protein